MITSTLIAFLLGAATVSIELAPDQPMPFVYPDEPLIIEVQSDVDAKASASLSVQSTQDTQAWTQEDDEVVLRANSPRWLVYDDLPTDYGYYAVLFRLNHGSKTEELRAHISRINRPFEGEPQPYSLFLEAQTAPALKLMRHVGVNAARVDINTPNAGEILNQASAFDVDVAVYVDGDNLELLAEQVQVFAQSYCPNIARWEIVTRGENGRLERLEDAASSANCAAPVYAVLRDASEVEQLMQQGGHSLVKGIIAEGVDVKYGTLLQWRDTIQQSGYESFPLETLNRTAEISASGRVNPLQLFDGFMQAQGGAQVTGLDARLLYQDTPGELLAYFNGLARQAVGYEPFGVMVLSANVSVPVSRLGNHWRLALYNPEGHENIQVALGKATDLRMTDAFNNVLPAPELKGEMINLDVGKRLVFLWGIGGDVLVRTARAHAGGLARRFSDNIAFNEYLPPGLMETVGAVAKDPGGLEGRTQYFQLLRSFPELEAQWHSGLLPRPVAVPAIAQLAALARYLCVLEEARGEVIIEPMNDMLMRARDLQSLYLTGTVGTNQPYNRGDWLLEEVRRLSVETHTLAESGARIEASALAALTEWRARALEFAAKAGPQSMLNSIGPVAELP